MLTCAFSLPDRTLSVHRLASLVYTRLLKGNAIPARATEAFPVHAAVLESLDRLHIVRPSNSFQLLMTLHALDEGTVGDLGTEWLRHLPHSFHR